MSKPKLSSRREFLKQAGVAGAAWLAAERLASARVATLANPVGYATISWPRADFDHALQTISSLGYKGVQMLGWVRSAYSADEADLRARLSGLKLEPVTLSCSGVRLDPANLGDPSDRMRAFEEFFKPLGGQYLQVTDGGKPDVSYTDDQVKALGEKMSALGRLAQSAGLTLGYHPHVGTLGETRAGLGRVLAATDPSVVKLIADVAHLTLGGSDPAEVIRTYRDRLLFCHFKDVRKDVAVLYKQNPAAARHARYHFCEVGKGVVNFPAILETFRATKFDGWIIVELDGYEPGPGGPDASARLNKQAIEKLGFRV